ncbi:hypothetical protein CEXT_95241 [Caerostris extrusa]|uniref:Secreted protein n=1 Tax=Caerostris extrusa TaxID=172846 RepID=A0AAV4PEX0_CAEEX|nr:hypothetical protein CEXT_95241 [Caerostris extrusa]
MLLIAELPLPLLMLHITHYRERHVPEATITYFIVPECVITHSWNPHWSRFLKDYNKLNNNHSYSCSTLAMIHSGVANSSEAIYSELR